MTELWPQNVECSILKKRSKFRMSIWPLNPFWRASIKSKNKVISMWKFHERITWCDNCSKNLYIIFPVVAISRKGKKLELQINTWNHRWLYQLHGVCYRHPIGTATCAWNLYYTILKLSRKKLDIVNENEIEVYNKIIRTRLPN